MIRAVLKVDIYQFVEYKSICIFKQPNSYYYVYMLRLCAVKKYMLGSRAPKIRFDVLFGW